MALNGIWLFTAVERKRKLRSNDDRRRERELFYRSAIATEGTVDRSTEIDGPDGSGYEVHVKYTDQHGRAILIRQSTTLDWSATKEQYEKYLIRTRVGSRVTVYHDPVDTHIYLLGDACEKVEFLVEEAPVKISDAQWTIIGRCCTDVFKDTRFVEAAPDASTFDKTNDVTTAVGSSILPVFLKVEKIEAYAREWEVLGAGMSGRLTVSGDASAIGKRMLLVSERNADVANKADAHR
jgi:hypothetical protein